MKKAASKKTRPSQPARQATVKKSSAKRPQEKSSPRSLAKPRTTKSSARAASSAKPVTFPPRKPTPEEVAYREALTQFEKAVNFFSQSEFSKARAILERLTAAPARDLAERARVYLKICQQRLAHSSVQLKTAEDLYNYAVRMANQGDLPTAEQSLNRALKLAPKSDYIYYALATTQALMGNPEVALGHLAKAIELNERNRYLAQNDPDFSSLSEDPRFTEMIYPEKPLS